MTVEDYRQCREYQIVFWDWIADVVFAEGLEGADITRFQAEVHKALVSIDPSVVP
ncbi:MAG: hypothetical protein AMXMBFR13_06990 [Phycisphaerae bacterium]